MHYHQQTNVRGIQFCKCNFIDGPLGAFDIHIYKSCPCFLDSKNKTLLQLYKSANSFKWNNFDFVSSFASFFECGNRAARSFIKCRCLHVKKSFFRCVRRYRYVIPRDESMSTRCLFCTFEVSLSAASVSLALDEVSFVSCL
jgi:hypothetical protein